MTASASPSAAATDEPGLAESPPLPAMSPEQLANSFRTTHWVLTHQAEGLSHADSLLQPQPRGNCFNWVLGHILASRSGMLELLGQEPIWPEARRARYRRGSAPVTSAEDEDVVDFQEMLADLETSQERLLAGFDALTSDALLAVVDEDNGTTRGGMLAFLFFHEAYHSGQTEQLRQLAGTDDQVIR